ncbi:hypothetical protein [Pseudoalteromonas rubra]|uniref:hypothetical protein n=1 Tax=Pseudoalteromonas rubra TaxID=43658 RepID=UPI002DBC4F77|nr:hypothetical protein [Pseudoalteromonas rubra]MEC4088753.1 hypothetical protein [Pseudoalteromonas rubra]
MSKKSGGGNSFTSGFARMGLQLTSTATESLIAIANAVSGGKTTNALNEFRNGMASAGLCNGVCEVQRQGINALNAKKAEVEQKKVQYQAINSHIQSQAIVLNSTEATFNKYIAELESFAIVWRKIHGAGLSEQQLKNAEADLSLNFKADEFQRKLKDLKSVNEVSSPFVASNTLEALEHTVTAINVLDVVTGVTSTGISIAASIRALSISSKVLAFGRFLGPAGWVITLLTIPIGMILNGVQLAEEDKALTDNLDKLNKAIPCLKQLDADITSAIKKEHDMMHFLDSLFPPLNGKSWQESMIFRTSKLLLEHVPSHTNHHTVDNLVSTCLSHIEVLSLKKALVPIAVNQYLADTTEFNDRYYQMVKDLYAKLGQSYTSAMTEMLKQNAITSMEQSIDLAIDSEKKSGFTNLQVAFPHQSAYPSQAILDMHIKELMNKFKASAAFTQRLESLKNDHQKMRFFSQELMKGHFSFVFEDH